MTDLGLIRNQATLQFLLARGIVASDALEQFFEKLRQVTKTPARGDMTCAQTLQETNELIGPLGMRIVNGVADDAVKYYCLINTKADAVSKVATNYTENELIFFRSIIAELIENESLRSMTIKQLSSNIKGLTMKQADVTMSKLVEEKWLYQAPDSNKYVLGIRCALELMPYIDAAFGDAAAPPCAVCKERVLRGPRCPSDACAARLHRRCARDWFPTKRESTCPACSTLFDASMSDKLKSEIQALRKR